MHHVYSGKLLTFYEMTNQKIPHCLNSSKIQSKNRRNRGKIDTLSTHIYDRSIKEPSVL